MIFDTHCHLYDEKYLEGGKEAIRTCISNGVSLMMIPGDNVENSRKALDLAKEFEEVYCAVGVHPECIDEMPLEEAIEQIRKLATSSNKVKAIGEIGIDRYWIKDEEVIEKQKKFFIAQIELANELGLPIIIHDRDAHEITLNILKEHSPKFGGVLHCFQGSVETMKEVLKIEGMYIGIDGPVTWKNAVNPKEIAKYCPLDRLVVETDSPYMTPAPFRGKTNYPHYVKYVIEEISKISEKVSREIEEVTYENGRKLFHI